MTISAASSSTEIGLNAYAQAQSSSLKKYGGSKAAVDQAAREFEGVFLSQVMETLFQDLNFGTALGEEQPGTEIYRSFLAQEYGKKFADAGGIGLAPYVTKELLAQQEVH